MAGKKGMKKGTLGKVLIGVGVVALVATVVSLAVKVDDMDKTDKVSATFGWEQGLLSTADGGEVKGTTSIRTKDIISSEELKCDLKEDASVEYQIFWYNEDDEFISATSSLSVDFSHEDGEIPETAEGARIMITPKNDPEVSKTEIASYAGERTVEWKK